jgi:hypothetical protein
MNTEPEVVEEVIVEEEGAPQPKGPFARYWDKVGGGSFTISLIVHGVFVVIALLIIWQNTSYKEPENIEFLSGGGGGTEGNTAINKKMSRMMANKAPAMKLSSTQASTFSIPESNSTFNISTSMSAVGGQMSGTPGTGGGFGGGNGTGRGKGNGPGVGPGSGAGFVANFMGMQSAGNNLIFCIDTSGSMRSNLKVNGIAAIRRELKKVISDMPPATQFNIICFGQNGDIFKPKSVTASQEMKNEALRFMEGYYGGGSADFGRTRTERFGKAGKDSQGIEYVPLYPDDVKELAGTEGGSRIDLAMVAAFERKPSTIFVLSDGAPGTKMAGDDRAMDKDKLIDLIHEKYKAIMGSTAKLSVNTISIQSDSAEGKEGEQFMKKLARKFSGKHKEVKPDKL